MSTLATLKAEIASDLARNDLTSEIASAINKAITYYQAKDFWFNQKRSLTFSTVADQARYSSSDDADIGLIKRVDHLFITINGNNIELDRLLPADFEALSDGNTASSQPGSWTYIEKQIGIYPTPDDVYTVRMLGLFKVAAPATDEEADNAWMTDGYELIRFRAAKELAAIKVRDYDFAQVCEVAEKGEYDRLRDETSKRAGTGHIVPTQF